MKHQKSPKNWLNSPKNMKNIFRRAKLVKLTGKHETQTKSSDHRKKCQIGLKIDQRRPNLWPNLKISTKFNESGKENSPKIQIEDSTEQICGFRRLKHREAEICSSMAASFRSSLCSSSSMALIHPINTNRSKIEYIKSEYHAN